MSTHNGNHEPLHCENCQIRSAGMFCNLPAGAAAAFTANKHTSTFPAGTFLFFERESNRGVYIVCSGQIKLSVSSSSGKTLILKIARPGDILGLSSSLTGAAYEATAEVLQTARVTYLRTDELRTIMLQYPDVYASIIRQLNLQYETACEQLRTIALCNSTTEKVARLLLQWSRQGRQTPEGTQFTVPLTHEQIAECVGATRETITRTLSDFRNKHLIALHGANMVIPDRHALAMVCGA
ncbi:MULTISPECIES: Crp/Fnr family transcriptional regulator [Acidobacterium]|uniref:Crp/Fnr family transcriptional regulator n=1 Tax=Acidobacterium TaxID=33973 RepID=UPI0003037008|nr:MULTISPECIES: Crp/Fnr family transcriptional regulator [Acidobacterium]HCT61986.1 Crp/Fnr family transcriptional regulator [Acidobacterium sp.]